MTSCGPYELSGLTTAVAVLAEVGIGVFVGVLVGGMGVFVGIKPGVFVGGNGRNVPTGVWVATAVPG